LAARRGGISCHSRPSSTGRFCIKPSGPRICSKQNRTPWANTTLADLASLIKEVAKEDKQRRAEVESVRTGLAKLQAIKV
jgi:hypothetical protein